jgi:hypothetical protein
MWHICAHYINLSGAALALILGDFAHVYLKTSINKRRKGGADMSMMELRRNGAAAPLSDSMAEATGSGWVSLNTRQRCDEACEFERELFKRIVAQDDAVFALSQRPRDEGIPALIAIAKNNRDPEIRKKAMFWLGQSGDPRALDLFEQILTRK